MSIVIDGKTYYSPEETAEKMGTSVGMLRYHRNAGHIQGFEMGTITYYSQEQIDAADFTPRKRGPKGKQVKTDGKPEENAHGASVPLKGRRGNRYEELALVGA